MLLAHDARGGRDGGGGRDEGERLGHHAPPGDLPLKVLLRNLRLLRAALQKLGEVI